MLLGVAVFGTEDGFSIVGTEAFARCDEAVENHLDANRYVQGSRGTVLSTRPLSLGSARVQLVASCSRAIDARGRAGLFGVALLMQGSRSNVTLHEAGAILEQLHSHYSRTYVDQKTGRLTMPKSKGAVSWPAIAAVGAGQKLSLVAEGASTAISIVDGWREHISPGNLMLFVGHLLEHEDAQRGAIVITGEHEGSRIKLVESDVKDWPGRLVELARAQSAKDSARELSRLRDECGKLIAQNAEFSAKAVRMEEELAASTSYSLRVQSYGKELRQLYESQLERWEGLKGFRENLAEVAEYLEHNIKDRTPSPEYNRIRLFLAKGLDQLLHEPFVEAPIEPIWEVPAPRPQKIVNAQGNKAGQKPADSRQKPGAQDLAVKTARGASVDREAGGNVDVSILTALIAVFLALLLVLGYVSGLWDVMWERLLLQLTKSAL